MQFKHFELERKYRSLVPVLVVIFSLGFHLINLEHASYDLDEAVHIWHAQKPYAEVIEQASNDPNPPIYNLIISAWVKQFGVSELSTRFFSVLMGVIGSVLMYFLAKRNFGLFVGVVAALLYTLSPIQFRFTHLARPYAMLMVTVLLSYGLMFELLRKQTIPKLLGYFLATSLMIYVHPTSVFNVPAQMLIVVIGRRSLKESIPFVSVSALAVLSFLMWVVSIPYFERSEAMWFDAPDLDAILYVIEVFYASPILIILQGLLLAYFLKALIDEKRERFSGLLQIVVWCVVPFLLSITFSHSIKPVFQDKYILSVQPALMLLLAVSIGKLEKPALRYTTAGLSMVLLLVQADFTRDSEGDWKSAVQYVKPMHSDSSLVLIDPWYELQTFAYYYDRSAFEDPKQTAKRLADKGIHTSWEDVYDVEIGESRADLLHIISAHEGHVEPVVSKSELDTLATLCAIKTFYGVAVRSYVFGLSLDTVAVIADSFEGGQGGTLNVAKNQEYTDLNTYVLHHADTSQVLRVTAILNCISGNDLSGVNFVIEIKREDGSVIVYESINAEGQLRKNKNNSTRLQFTVSAMDFDCSSVVKTYLWNSKGADFVADDFELIVEN